jgi:hypothetical protein
MRFSLAYYLLLLYTTAIFKPLVPIISDAWGHAFAEAEHIATVHAKYGANHLEKQLLAGEKDTNGKSQDNTKNADPVPVHFAEEQQNNPLILFLAKSSYNSCAQYNPCCIFLPKQIQPPQVSK